MKAILILVCSVAGLAVGAATQPEFNLQSDNDSELAAALAADEESPVEDPWNLEELEGEERLKVLLGGPRRSFLGIGVSEIDGERAKELQLKEERGVEITRVEPDGPADRAGVKKGDVVIEYNNQRVEGTEQFVRMVRETPPGRQVKFVVSRQGQTHTLVVTVGSAKDHAFHVAPKVDFDRLRKDLEGLKGFHVMPEMHWEFDSWKGARLGVVVESLQDQLAEYFGVKEGVLVRSVMKGSSAEKAGIKAGDVIVKIDEEKITSARELTKAVRAARAKKTFPVTVSRKGKEMTLSVTLEDDRSSVGERKEERVIRKTGIEN